MRKLLLITLLSVFFCLGGKAQDLRIIDCERATYSNYTKRWTYEGVKPFLSTMELNNGTLYVRDDANSFYKLRKQFDEKDNAEVYEFIYHAVDERNRACLVGFRTYKQTGKKYLLVMYYYETGAIMYSYQYLPENF